MRDLYDDGDALVLTNVGPLVEPMTREAFDSGAAARPASLFAHNMQRKAVMSVDADNLSAKGVIGKIRDALARQGLVTNAYSIEGETKVLEDEGVAGGYDVIDRSSGVIPFDEQGTSSALLPHIGNLTRLVSTSALADTWASALRTTLARNEQIGDALDEVELTQDFEYSDGNKLGQQLEHVAALIKARSEGHIESARDFFYVVVTGFDTHSDVDATLSANFGQINEALDSFAQELKNQGVWGNVTIVTASDFGRTLTSNGKGTDHGWGGNYFMAGGAVRGGHVKGAYPDDLTDEGPYNAGRGRVIPTTSWEAIWQGIAQWLGVGEEHMDTVLPNRRNFDAADRFNEGDLFVA